MLLNEVNEILYIGQDEAYADSLAKILNFHKEEFRLDRLFDLSDIKNAVRGKPYGALILDAGILEKEDRIEIEQILNMIGKSPLVMIVDKGQESLGQYAIEKGAFDYLVRVEGALTSIPFTINRALEYKAEQKDDPIEFEYESDQDEVTSFFEINETGRFLTFDDHLSDILGYSNKYFYKSYLMDFIVDIDHEKFYIWRASQKKQQVSFLIKTQVVHRKKGIIPIELQLQPYSKPELLFSGFRGYIKTITDKPQEKTHKKTVDSVSFFKNIYQLNSYLRDGFNQLFLMKLPEIPYKLFHFSGASLFLYSKSKNKYLSELSIGDLVPDDKIDLRSDYFEPSEIDYLFQNEKFVRFVHQSVLHDQEREKISGSSPHELFQEKQWQPGKDWQIGDRLFLNLKASNNSCFGFIVFERPDSGKIPDRSILTQAEIYSIFASSLYEAHNRLTKIETKYKQLRQIFTILETFNIGLPLEGLLKEIVWTIKFSLNYNLSALAILSKNNGLLQVRAVAVENKEKADAISRLNFTIEEISPLLKEKYRISQSYFISEKKSSFFLMKRIYGLPLAINKSNNWNQEDLLLVPIRRENNSIIGFFILDDPADKLQPVLELVQILEKIAKLIAATIQNKLIYTELKSKNHNLEAMAKLSKNLNNYVPNSKKSSRLKKIFQRINLD